MGRLRRVSIAHPVAVILSVGAVGTAAVTLGVLLGQPGWNTSTWIRLVALTVVLSGFAMAFWIRPLLESRR